MKVAAITLVAVLLCTPLASGVPPATWRTIYAQVTTGPGVWQICGERPFRREVVSLRLFRQIPIPPYRRLIAGYPLTPPKGELVGPVSLVPDGNGGVFVGTSVQMKKHHVLGQGRYTTITTSIVNYKYNPSNRQGYVDRQVVEVSMIWFYTPYNERGIAW
jgi:hypothetical protein